LQCASTKIKEALYQLTQDIYEKGDVPDDNCKSIILLIKSYLTERALQIRHYSVLQGGILSPILFNIFVLDQPITLNTSVADYADDKVIFSINDDPLIATLNLQAHLDSMGD